MEVMILWVRLFATQELIPIQSFENDATREQCAIALDNWFQRSLDWARRSRLKEFDGAAVCNPGPRDNVMKF